MKTRHFIISLLALLTSISTSAHTWTDANGTEWYFTTSGSKATIANRGFYTNTIDYIPSISGTIPNDLTIPSTVYIAETAYAVTSIGYSAFRGCSSLTSINIPEGVTSIGNNAFNGCSSLTSINIPEGVTSIEKQAFYHCSSLTSINIPEGVTSIENSAFDGCSSLTAINIPDGVTSIGGAAFYGCSSLTSINILEGVTSIGSNAFTGCSSLTSIHFASSTPKVTYSWNSSATLFVPDEAVDAYKSAWPDYAAHVVPETSFSYTYGIDVTAKSSSSAVIEEIGEENALKVVNLKVTGSINSYDVMVFRNKMLNLRNLDLSDATIVASEYTYYNNEYKTKDNVVTGYFAPSTLLSLTLPNNITALDDYAIYGCTYLASISIPESVTSIGVYAFSGCSRLASINIPDGVTSIGRYTFYGCSSLISITIGNGVTSIGNGAFDDCSSLTSINIPEGVTAIGNYAFYYCSSLTSINLPKGLKTIGAGAFGGCSSLSSIKLPPFVSSLGNDAFKGCTKLNTVYVYIPDYTLSINETAFSTYTTAELRIPNFLYNDYYYSQGGWKRFINMVRCELEPGDYENLLTNSDTSISSNDDIIPNISEGNPIDSEIQNEGSITVADEVTTPQEFDTVEQNLNGEGQGGSLIGNDDGETQGNLVVAHLRVKINVKAGRWYFFCFPYDVTVSDCEYPGQYAWRYYDGAVRAENGNGGWKPVTGDKLNAQQGYAFQSSHAGKLVVKFEDPKFGGNRGKSLEAHVAANAQNASWNLVGNPYSCFYEFDENDFTSPITLWNGSSYTAYRPGDDDCHLQPYEAFFVQKPETVDFINFEAERRETYRQAQEKQNAQVKAFRAKGINQQRHLINLEIMSGEEAADHTRVVLNPNAAQAYEIECDAAKFLSTGASAQLYSVENGVQMAINERPLQGDIRLGYIAKTAGKLSISASRMDIPMMLVDTKLNTTFDLTLGSYDFETAAGTFDNRFLLRLSGEETAINNLAAKTGISIGTQDGGIVIGNAEGKTINVYTTGGAQAAQHTGNGFISLARGIYVVSVDGMSAKISVE